MNRSLFLSLAVSMTMLGACRCGSGGPRGTRIEVEVSDVFLTRAKAERWTLVSGSCFYRLDVPVACLGLPKHGVDTAVELSNTEHIGSFHFSPVTQQIVVESRDRVSPAENPHLLIWDLELKTVWSDPALLHYDIYSDYRWSPDAKLISFAHGNDIRLLDVAKKTYRTLVNDHVTVVRDGQAYATPAWSEDSTRLVYQTAENRIAIVDVRSGEKEAIGAGMVPSWSPDGSKIVFVEKTFRSDKNVFLYDVRSGKTETLFQTGFDFAHIWSPDSRFLVFRKDLVNSIYGGLRAYDFETQKVVSTGQKVATLRDAQIEVLPASFIARLREVDSPNR